MKCSYCESQVFEKDRVCKRCGAPVGEFKNVTITTASLLDRTDREDSFGQWIRQIEETEPILSFDDGLKSYLKKYISKPLKNFIGQE